MNAKQRRVARRAAERQIDAEPLFLVEAFGRTYARDNSRHGAVNRPRVRVEAITIELAPPDPAAP